MDRVSILSAAEEKLRRPLSTWGYLLVADPPATDFRFWFEKVPVASGDVFKIIEFQLSGFDEGNLIKTAVNLARRPFRDFHDPRNYEGEIVTLHVRLAPCLWETEAEKKAMDQWWHFGKSIEKLQAAYEDILDKLVRYGIPFLEDPDSSWWTYSGKKPPK